MEDINSYLVEMLTRQTAALEQIAKILERMRLDA